MFLFADQDYHSLCDKLREISTLGGIGGLLQWDEAVMMPAGAAESRGKQKSVLAGVVYEKVFVLMGCRMQLHCIFMALTHSACTTTSAAYTHPRKQHAKAISHAVQQL